MGEGFKDKSASPVSLFAEDFKVNLFNISHVGYGNVRVLAKEGALIY